MCNLSSFICLFDEIKWQSYLFATIIFRYVLPKMGSVLALFVIFGCLFRKLDFQKLPISIWVASYGFPVYRLRMFTVSDLEVVDCMNLLSCCIICLHLHFCRREFLGTLVNKNVPKSLLYPRHNLIVSLLFFQAIDLAILVKFIK